MSNDNIVVNLISQTYNQIKFSIDVIGSEIIDKVNIIQDNVIRKSLHWNIYWFNIWCW